MKAELTKKQQDNLEALIEEGNELINDYAEHPDFKAIQETLNRMQQLIDIDRSRK